MLLREIFKNLHTVMVILALFEQFSGSLFIFLVPIFECFIKYDAFCKHMQFRLCVLKALSTLERHEASPCANF